MTREDMTREEIITKALIDFNSLPKIKGWVARDRNGALHFHKDKPHREYDCAWYTDWKRHPEPEIFHLRLPKQMDFPELKWEDEPIEVELLIKKV